MLFICCLCILQTQAQQLPVSITVPPVCTDVNQQFGIISFDVNPGTGKFTILYYQVLNASVATNKEYMEEPGDYVYENSEKKRGVPNSAQVLLLVRQVVDKSGDATTDKVWVLAKRKMESADVYKMYFRKNFNHPIIKSDVEIKLTVHNLDNVEGMTDKEREQLTMFVKKEFMPEGGYNYVYNGRANTMAEDIHKIANDFKSLGSLSMRGNLPKTEDVVTRYEIVPKKNFAITKEKGETSTIYRFYLTADYKDYQMVDSFIITGSMSIIGIERVYNMSTKAVGVFAAFQHKYTDSAKNDQSEIVSVVLNDNDDLGHWSHTVGKSKLSSLRPEVCWLDGKKCMVMSSNTEKIFKPYYQVHQFEMGKPAVTLFPATDEEKSSEKYENVKTFQVETPGSFDGTLPEKVIPMGFVPFENTMYIVGQDFAKDQTTHADKYMAMKVYRIKDGKLTNINSLNGYKNGVPAIINPLVENTATEALMLNYPMRIQLLMNKDKCLVSPIETTTNRLVSNEDGSFVSGNNEGLTLLSKTTMGTKYTLFYYPAK